MKIHINEVQTEDDQTYFTLTVDYKIENTGHRIVIKGNNFDSSEMGKRESMKYLIKSTAINRVTTHIENYYLLVEHLSEAGAKADDGVRAIIIDGVITRFSSLMNVTTDDGKTITVANPSYELLKTLVQK